VKKSELKQLIKEEIKKSINESTITHYSIAGDTRELDLDLTQFDNFLLSLQPLVGEEYDISPATRNNIMSYIIKYLGGYGTLGGGIIRVD
jgi:hypothetical protein